MWCGICNCISLYFYIFSLFMDMKVCCPLRCKRHFSSSICLNLTSQVSRPITSQIHVHLSNAQIQSPCTKLQNLLWWQTLLPDRLKCKLKTTYMLCLTSSISKDNTFADSQAFNFQGPPRINNGIGPSLLHTNSIDNLFIDG